MPKTKTETVVAPVAPVARVKVRVIHFMGFAGDPPRRRRIGDVFTISGARFPEGHPKAGELKEFASKWMELVPANTPERSTSPIEAARLAESQMVAGTARMDIHGTVHPDEDEQTTANEPTGAANVLG